VIILDHAGTALGEALLTRKPLIVYAPGSAGSIPEAPDARALLRKRALVAETGLDFIATIDEFLRRSDFSEVIDPDQEFLRAYGTYIGDGKSAERGAEAIACGARSRET
jgi:hypothetical protein